MWVLYAFALRSTSFFEGASEQIRGKVLGMESKGRTQIVRAQVPLVEILKYAPDLRSMSAGRGMFTMKFAHYEEIPAQLQEKIIEAGKQEQK